MKFNVAEFIKEVADTIKTSLKPMEVKLEGFEVKMKDFEPFDNSENMKRFEGVNKGLESIEPYDDSKAFEALKEIKAKQDNYYIRLDELDQTDAIDLINEGLKSIKGYDDSELQRQINAMQELHEKEITKIKEKTPTIIQVQASSAKHYTGDPEEKGTMILYGNSLYVNMQDDNDSVPSDENKSYKLLIKAPKTPEHKGLYEEGVDYEESNIVMKDNSSWMRTDDPDNTLPSAGWKLLSKGVRGKKGERGDTTIPKYDKVLQDLHDEINLLKGTVKELQDGLTSN